MTPDDAKHLKAGTPVQFKGLDGAWMRGEVLEDATTYLVRVKWSDGLCIQNFNPRDMNDIHRAKRNCHAAPNEDKK